ncbi:MAG TPA: hypothetical protein VJB36_14965, partial [Methylomirabilota bacterium]|nr:hypothetical protein [Methylomirabilota bacterium]
HDPQYLGPHEALGKLGEVEVRRIVRECVDVYGRVCFVVRDAPESPRDLVSIRPWKESAPNSLRADDGGLGGIGSAQHERSECEHWTGPPKMNDGKEV